jgi:hypothetical protein
MTRYPDPDKALRQVQRNAYHHAHGPTAPKPDARSMGISTAQVAANIARLTAGMRLPGIPVGESRCAACGKPDDDCRCTWNTP